MSLICPKCSKDVNPRLVARTKSCEVGIVRQRFCVCGANVTTIERVLDADIDGILVDGLAQGKGGSGPLSQVCQLVRALGGGVVRIRP